MNDLSKFVNLTTYRDLYYSIKNDALFKRLLRNSSYLLSATVIANGLMFVQSILLARFLGVEQYGVLALIMTYVMAVNQLLDFRVWETVIKYVSEFWVNDEKARAWAMIKLAYWIDLLTGVFAFSVAVLAAPLAASLLHRSEIASLAGILAFKLLFSTVNGTSGAILRVFDKFRWISIQNVSQAAITLGLVASVLLVGYGLKELLVAYIVSAFVGTLIYLYFSFKVIRSNMRSVRREGNIFLLRSRFREIGWFLFHTNINAFWGMFIRQFDVLILGHFRGANEVAYFKMAKNFTQLVGKVHDPLYKSIFPEITKLWLAGDIRKFTHFLKKLTVITSSIFLFIALGMFSLCGIVINMTVGSEFAPSVLSVRIMLWGITVGCIFTWARPMVIAIGKPQIGNLTSFIGACFFFIFSLFFVPIWGHLGTAITWVLLYLITQTIMICYLMSFLRRSGASK